MTDTASARPLPPGVLVAFYGDDLTGSTSTLEALAFTGLDTVLFLDEPTPERLARYGDRRAVGIAGIARSRSPAWMDEVLPGLFRSLATLQAPVNHYKVCSTFDSSPSVGSIGRAIEIGAPILGGGWHPLLVAAPQIGRYQAFGNLFAVFDEANHRLDRHPAMARHPVTPIDEADLRRHLGRQTSIPVGLVDLAAMKRGGGDAALDAEMAAGARIVAIDLIDRETSVEAGRLIWERAGERVFVVGSQGVEYALVDYWTSAGLLAQPAVPKHAKRVDQIVCVSGSCSPVTAGQISRARSDGFATIRLAAERAVDQRFWESALQEAIQAALDALGRGCDPLVYTAAGPDDPAVAALADAVAASGSDPSIVNDRIGDGLGRILDRVMTIAGVSRAVIAGGDTSSHAARALGIDALTALAPLVPGAPLCIGHTAGEAADSREIVLKGGQIGPPNVFGVAREGSLH